jgi:hypothetical protein
MEIDKNNWQNGRQSSFSTRWARVNKDLIEVTTLELSDFVEDNTYTFRVIAENKAGPSNPSLYCNQMNEESE